jgi:hypothetical protein
MRAVHEHSVHRRRRRAQSGASLAIAMFTMSALLVSATGGLLVASSNTFATRNYRGTQQVRFVAESALAQALQTFNQNGIRDFQADVVNQWTARYGTGARDFTPLPGFTYTVRAQADVADPINRGFFIATARGPENTMSVATASLVRSVAPFQTPGALHLARNGATNSSFSGDGFVIDGNDRRLNGLPGANAPIPGMSTLRDANTQEAIGSLAANQRDNVKGEGYLGGPPALPSVKTMPYAPNATQVNALVNNWLNMPHRTVALPDVLNLLNPPVYGTEANPEITHMTFLGGVRVLSKLTGAGILIVDSDLTIIGTFQWKGLVVVRGKFNIVTETVSLLNGILPITQSSSGNVLVQGSVWTNDVQVGVGGAAQIYYSSEALALAQLAGPGQTVNQPLAITSIADCGQVAAGVSGC